LETRKIIIIDEDVDKILTNIYDAALKFAGMQIRVSINSILQAIKEEQIHPIKDNVS